MFHRPIACLLLLHIFCLCLLSVFWSHLSHSCMPACMHVLSGGSVGLKSCNPLCPFTRCKKRKKKKFILIRTEFSPWKSLSTMRTIWALWSHFRYVFGTNTAETMKVKPSHSCGTESYSVCISYVGGWVLLY